MTRISKYSPSQNDPDLLEPLTVGEDRLRLLDDIVDRATRAQESQNRTHTLIIGPRGAGKTHLVTLAHHRIGRSTNLTRSWLHEEGWMTLLGFNDFLIEILAASDDEVLQTAATGSKALRVDALGAYVDAHGPVVVFVENFDQVLTALDNKGQQRLRQLMENSRSLLFVATTTELSRDLSKQNSPFYGYFTTHTLKKFELGEAREMLERLGDLSDDLNLEELDDSVIDARLAAIAHLAGGQPRMWSMFGQTVSASELEELVPAFVELIDNVTPYYQQQLERRSTLQRRIISLLARADHPMNVKEVADELDLEQKATAAALSDLRDARWVEHSKSPFATGLDKRLRYHELSEPLVRAMLQSKDVRGETPIQVVVEFIKHWFELDDLESTAPVPGLAQSYVQTAAQQVNADGVTATALQLTGLVESTGAPRVKLLGRIDDAISAYLDDDPTPIMRLPTTIRRALEDRIEELSEVRLSLHSWVSAEFGNTPHSEMTHWEKRAGDLFARSGSSSALMWLNEWQIRRWHFEAALTSLIQLHEILGPDHPDTLTTRNNLAESYRAAGRIDEAITLHKQNLNDSERILGPDHPSTLTTRNNLTSSYRAAGRIDEAEVTEG